jgi:hypothetical protein
MNVSYFFNSNTTIVSDTLSDDEITANIELTPIEQPTHKQEKIEENNLEDTNPASMEL